MSGKIRKRLASGIVRKLQDEGFQAYFAGGCVRDLVMGRIPKDYDIVTDARPEEVSASFRRTVPVGKEFGILLVVKNRIPFEVATFRAEKHGEFSADPRADVKRRDFTVNGLLYDPVKEKVLDYVEGRKDIRGKKIRFNGIPEERIREDALRLVRAVRLAVNLDFSIEEKSFLAVKKMSSRIGKVSGERIRDELSEILTGPYPHRGISLLDETGLLEMILPEIIRMKSVKQPPEFHPEGDVFTHTMLMLKELKNTSIVLALAVLLHDVGKNEKTFTVSDRIRFNGHDVEGGKLAREVMERLKFPGEEW